MTLPEALRQAAPLLPQAADEIDGLNARHDGDMLALTAATQAVADQAVVIADLRRQLEESSVPTPAPVGALGGALWLETFKTAKNTWDDSFQAAHREAAAVRGKSTITPPIIFPTDRVDDLKTPTKVYDGMKLIYPFGVGSIQRAAESIPCDVRYSGAAPMFYVDQANVFDVQMSGISFQSNNGGQFFDTRKNVVWTSVFRDLGFNGWRNGFGSPAEQFHNTACLFDGWWNVNNCRGTFATFGGSDTQFAWSQFLIDVSGNAGYRAEFAAAKSWLLDFAWQQKGRVTGIYATVEGAANGVRVRNPNEGGPLTFEAPIIEGRNANSPTTGVTFQVDSGTVVIHSPWISYGNRAASDKSGALLVVNGGDVTVTDPHYGQATARKSAVEDIWGHVGGGVLNIDRVHGPIRVRRAGGTLNAPAAVAA